MGRQACLQVEKLALVFLCGSNFFKTNSCLPSCFLAAAASWSGSSPNFLWSYFDCDRPLRTAFPKGRHSGDVSPFTVVLRALCARSVEFIRTKRHRRSSAYARRTGAVPVGRA